MPPTRLNLDRDLQLGIGEIDAADEALLIPNLHLALRLRQAMAPQQPSSLAGSSRLGCEALPRLAALKASIPSRLTTLVATCL